MSELFTHLSGQSQFGLSLLLPENAGSRMTAREKLTRLTMQQFQELSTDVYDELVRRNNNTAKNEGVFTPSLPWII